MLRKNFISHSSFARAIELFICITINLLALLHPIVPRHISFPSIYNFIYSYHDKSSRILRTRERKEKKSEKKQNARVDNLHSHVAVSIFHQVLHIYDTHILMNVYNTRAYAHYYTTVMTFR